MLFNEETLNRGVFSSSFFSPKLFIAKQSQVLKLCKGKGGGGHGGFGGGMGER